MRSQPYNPGCQTPMRVARIENLQNRELRIATGQLVSTTVEVLRMEASVPSYTTTSIRNVLKEKEISLSISADHPKRIQSRNTATATHEIQLAQKASELSKALPDALNHRQQNKSFNIPPGHLNAADSYSIYCCVPGISNRTISLKARMSTKCIDNHHADCLIYTDGLATLVSKDSGFAVVITEGPATNPTTIDTIKERGRVFTCSFEEELATSSTALH